MNDKWEKHLKSIDQSLKRLVALTEPKSDASLGDAPQRLVEPLTDGSYTRQAPTEASRRKALDESSPIERHTEPGVPLGDGYDFVLNPDEAGDK